MESPETEIAVGVSVTAVDESELPAFVTARSLIVYPVPLDRPVKVIGEAVVPVGRLVHAPLLDEYW